MILTTHPLHDILDVPISLPTLKDYSAARFEEDVAADALYSLVDADATTKVAAHLFDLSAGVVLQQVPQMSNIVRLRHNIQVSMCTTRIFYMIVCFCP